MSLKCSLCNQPVKPDTRRVVPFGPIGPECIRKVSGLPAFLDRFDLTEFEAGPVVYPAVRGTDGEGLDTWIVPRTLLEARARALQAGLRLTLERAETRDERPMIKATLKIPGIVGAKDALLNRVRTQGLEVAA